MASDQRPAVCDILRTRADTFPFTMVFTDASSGLAIDLTGSTFKLTVDPSEEPTDALGNLFTNVPTIVAPATNGRIQITLSAGDADQTPNEYFYDIEQIDGASAVRTLVKGKWAVEQDITK